MVAVICICRKTAPSPVGEDWGGGRDTNSKKRMPLPGLERGLMYAASNKSVVDIEKSDSKCFEVIEHLLGKTAGFTHRTAYPLA